jgi:hypothetical protein
MSGPQGAPVSKKWSDSVPNGKVALEALLVEVDLQTEIAVRSFKDFVDEWDQNRPPFGAPPEEAFAFSIRVWRHVHAVLTAAAIVSRITCEGPGERVAEVKLSLGATPAPILESRDLRDSLEHIDQRITEFVASLPPGSRASPISYATPRPPDRILGLMLRYLNPDDTHLRIFAPPGRDRDVVLRDVVQAMVDLNRGNPFSLSKLGISR